MSDDVSPDAEVNAMLSRLMSRRTAPGMLDLDALRPGRPAAGLGLGASPVVRQLRARLSGEAMPAVASGELVLAQRGSPGDIASVGTVPRTTTATPARAGVATSSAPVIAPAGMADGTAGPAPIVQETGRVPTSKSASPAALLLGRAQGGFAGGESAAGLASAPGIDIDTGTDTAMRRGIAVAASSATGVPAALTAVAELPSTLLAQPSLPLPRAASQTSAPALPGMPAAAPHGFADPMPASSVVVPSAAHAPYAPPAASVHPQAAFPATASVASASFEDLPDRIARDLRRRLAVERERQGRPRWKD